MVDKNHAKVHPEEAERLTYFFIPLPENLGIPDMFFVPIRTDDIHHQPSVKCVKIEDIPFDVEYSIMFHQIKRGADTEGFEAAFNAAEPYFKQKKDKPATSTEKLNIEGQTTVAEVMCVVSEHSEKEANRVFEQSIRHVNNFINSYYIVGHQPKRLVSPSALPPLIPFINRTVTSESEPNIADGELGLYAVNPTRSGVPTAKESLLSPEELKALPAAMERTTNGLLDVYNDIRREADIALRDGNLITAAILFESAAEVILRETLLFLQWEEGTLPADAAPTAKTHDLNDILAGLESRLSGNWSRTAGGPIKDWTVNLALLRDTTVHTGYRPTDGEVKVAHESFVNLIKYIADRISRNWDRYPLAANSVIGTVSVEKRIGKKTEDLKNLINELYSPQSISESFGRWKYEVERTFKGRKAWTSHPDSCRMVLLVYPSGEKLWWLVDYDKRLARRARDPLLDVPAKNIVETTLSGMGAVNSVKSILIKGVRGKALTNGRIWYEAYKVLPLFEIDRWPRTYPVYAYHRTLK